MEIAEQIARTREFAGLGRLEDRGLIEVTGSERERWLDGMVSNDIAGLEAGDEASGCYALLLSRVGRIVADFHVLLRPESLWLETRRDAIPRVLEHLERYIIADDVEVKDISANFEQWTLEGPRALAMLSAATKATVSLSRFACCELRLGGDGLEFVAAAFGHSGEVAFRLIGSEGWGETLAAAIRATAESEGATRIASLDAAALEVLRIEAGLALLGSELDEGVLPDDARLEHGVSTTKGCYTGQEVIARLRSRGSVKHLLVGLRFDANELPEIDVDLAVEGKRTGEVTSRCHSPVYGNIGLGYVRIIHAEPGQRLDVAGGSAEVVALPFAALDAGGTS